jgi:hypothetical protein
VNLKCPPLLEDEVLVSIGKKYSKSSAQVALRFNVQRGVVVIPKSFSPQRIHHNFQVSLVHVQSDELRRCVAVIHYLQCFTYISSSRSFVVDKVLHTFRAVIHSYHSLFDNVVTEWNIEVVNVQISTYSFILQ